MRYHYLRASAIAALVQIALGGIEAVAKDVQFIGSLGAPPAHFVYVPWPEHAKRSGPLSIDRSILNRLLYSRQLTDSTVTLKIFEDRTIEIDEMAIEHNENGSTTIVGNVRNAADGEAIFTIYDDAISARIDAGFEQYLIEGSIDKAEVLEVDPAFFSKFVTEQLESIPRTHTEHGDHAPASPLVGSTIDILVLYTVDTSPRPQTPSEAIASAQTLVSDLSSSFSQSGILHTARLITALPFPEFVESAVPSPQLPSAWTNARNRMRAGTGEFVNLPSIRTLAAADVVVLKIAGSAMTATCGIGTIMSTPAQAADGFAIVSKVCAAGDRTFSHEVGHVLGGRHDWAADPTDNSPFHFNHGYWHASPDFRTIMAYGESLPGGCTLAGCPRINRWSSPNQAYAGVPLGVGEPQPTDMVQTLSSTVPTVANYKSTAGQTLPGTPSGVNYCEVIDSPGRRHRELRWQSVSNGLWYQAQFAASSSFVGAELAYNGRATSTHSPLRPPGISWARVRACNGLGCGSYSVLQINAVPLCI